MKSLERRTYLAGRNVCKALSDNDMHGQMWP